MFQLCTRSVEFRATENSGDGDGRTLEGYAAVFNQDTEINSWEGHFTERIAKGAFKKTLKERKPVMQFDHGRDARTGSVPIGKFVELREDADGLYVQARLFDNPVVEPVRQAIEGGAIDGMSFKFRVTRDEWRDAKGKLVKGDDILSLLYEPGERGPLQRTIREVQLSECGPVVFPAYAGTSVGVRSLENMTDADRESLAAEYRRTMLEEDEDEKRVKEWLDAETRWQCEQWLEAENVYRWLEAEKHWNETRDTIDPETKKAARNAGRKATLERNSSPAKDAGRKTTSRRDAVTPQLNTKKDKVMNLAEMRARLAEIATRYTELDEEHRDADFPDEAQTEWDGLESEEADLRSKIEKIEKRNAKLLDQVKNGQKGTEKGSDRGTPAFHRSDENIYSLEEIRKESFSGNDFVARCTDAARKGLDKVHMPVQAHERAKEEIEQLLLADSESGYVAKRMVATGSPAYERAFGKAMKAQDLNALSRADWEAVDEARAIAVTSPNGDGAGDPTGGLAVPFQLDPTLVHLGAGYVSPIRQLARTIQLYGKEFRTLTISQIAVYRALEAAVAVDSSPTLDEAVLRVNKVHAFVPFSMEAEEDWAGMRAEIFQLLGEAKDREEATAFLLGTGVAPQPEGLITGIPAGSEVTTGTTTFTQADIYALMEALPVEFEPGAVFLGTKQIFNRIRQLDNTANQNQLWGSGDLQNGNPRQLLDTPTYRVTGMDSTTAAGKRFLVYGDIRKAFTILDRIGMSVELVPMLMGAVTPAAGAALRPMPTGQRGFYAHWRNNSKVVDPNAVRILKGHA